MQQDLILVPSCNMQALFVLQCNINVWDRILCILLLNCFELAAYNAHNEQNKVYVNNLITGLYNYQHNALYSIVQLHLNN
jgi:hypothetical protein